MQETDFDYEILVHDDASTDGTSTIIREYERKYPGLIKPIYQTENQYSKGVRVDVLNAERGLGKYIALCEGDDYWMDPSKLQRQVSVMESDPDCALCVHSSVKVSPGGAPVGEMRVATSDRTLTLDEILATRKEFPTASMLFPTRYFSELPDYFFKAPVGDRPLALFLASRGAVRYLDRKMSAYRINAVNSWTLRIREDSSMRISYNQGMADMFETLDRETGLAHTEALQRLVKWHQFAAAQLGEDYEEVQDPKYSEFYRELDWRYRAVITLRRRAPRIAFALANASGLVRRMRGVR